SSTTWHLPRDHADIFYGSRGHTADVLHDLPRKQSPARAECSELGTAVVLPDDLRTCTVDSVGRSALGSCDTDGVFPGNTGDTLWLRAVYLHRFYRRSFCSQRTDYCDHPGAFHDVPEPPDSASLATHSTRRHLPLAAMETPRADYRADLGWIPVLLHPQRQPEHTRDQQYRSDRWPAVPALDYCAAV